MKKFLCALCAATAMFGIAACGIGDTNTTYNRADIGRVGTSFTGRIVQMIQIDVAGDTRSGSLVGAGVGGALGGVGGSTLGGGKGTKLLTIGGAAVGALAGGALGAAASQAATKDTAYEFWVQTNRYTDPIPIVQTNELGLKPGDSVILGKVNGKTRIRAKMY